MELSFNMRKPYIPGPLSKAWENFKETDDRYKNWFKSHGNIKLTGEETTTEEHDQGIGYKVYSADERFFVYYCKKTKQFVWRDQYTSGTS